MSSSEGELGFFSAALPDEDAQDNVAEETTGMDIDALEQPELFNPIAVSDVPGPAPVSMSDLASTHVSKVAQKHWLHASPSKKGKKAKPLHFSQNVVDEFCQTHVLSIAAMVNEKFRERVANGWSTVTADAEKFSVFFRTAIKLIIAESLGIPERKGLLVFLINSFQSLENAVVRAEAMKLVGISVWHSLRDIEKLEMELSKAAGLRKTWNKAEKKRASASKDSIFNEQFFMSTLVKLYYQVLASIPFPPTQSHHQEVMFCERFVEFVIDLISQLPTRRYLNTLLKDHHFFLTSVRSDLFKYGNEALNRNPPVSTYGAVYVKLIQSFDFYEQFEIDETTGLSLTRDDANIAYYERIQKLQKFCFLKYKDNAAMQEFSLEPVGLVGEPQTFRKHFLQLEDDVLESLCVELGLRVEVLDGDEKLDKQFLVDALCRIYCKKPRQLDVINSLSVYPNEVSLFICVGKVLNTHTFFNNHCLPIPKLNIQFLTLQDYLFRTFELYRLEAAYEIRQDVEDAVKRLAPKYTPDADSLSGTTVFSGWARMAVPIDRFEIAEVGTPSLGETKPSFVTAEVSFAVGRYSDAIRREWESLRRHDVLFLLTIEMDPEVPSWTAGSSKEPGQNGTKTSFRKQFGVKHIRGCMVVDALDGDGKPEDGRGSTNNRRGALTRTIRVLMDANQYEQDTARVTRKETKDVYSTFNVLLRRKSSENNFKSVVEAIRDIMQASDIVVPDWLQDVLLGYGDPAAATYTNLKDPITTLDFRDTFLDWEHIEHSFPEMGLEPTGSLTNNGKRPPFVLKFPQSMFSGLTSNRLGKRKHDDETGGKKIIEVDTYKPLNMGPFLEDLPKKNSIRFTKKQGKAFAQLAVNFLKIRIAVEAIVSGTSPGLTLVVGPPGTGKTDVTVQIMANIYHNFPQEKTLLITHSNQALNQLFEKIMQLDIDPRHILRLGHGTEELNSEESWGKYGRVNSFLEKRLTLLAQVDVLAASLAIPGAHGYTCETAENFFNQHVCRLWDSFSTVLKTEHVSVQAVVDKFPFHNYFSNAPGLLFHSEMTAAEAVEVAEGCYRHICKIFAELADVRAFELLRNSHDRSNYLLIKEAKIVALTCTHAALKRREFVALGFKYHNVVMEEAAQILEVESFIPLLLQSADQETGQSRLRRVVMVGDHHQLPPIVQNTAFQKFANMEQSLFARLVRLGVPTVELDMQGRCRSGIADLFRWNYEQLQDLSSVVGAPQFQTANPGFAFDYQFVDVRDYLGKGETEPIPHFLQNLGEAEYAVAMFQYMRLLGYPASTISIITTYNGQKALIEDVLEKRCRWNPLFGLPAHVSTVDKFQGQQNDYVLLSLVRTRTVGHLRDVRRLIVALSRARLGLYVFGRRELFANCFELQPAFEKFQQRPTSALWLRGSELWTDDGIDRVVDDVGMEREGDDWVVKPDAKESVFEIKDVIHMGSYVHQMIEEQLEYMKKQKEELMDGANSGNNDPIQEIDE
ncbi:hypothetical protein HDU83_002042 [Entophlyctis luteolus]|nr:hypothetical protein HDU83_002042 [Entophlyctis luteolus]